MGMHRQEVTAVSAAENGSGVLRTGAARIPVPPVCTPRDTIAPALGRSLVALGARHISVSPAELHGCILALSELLYVASAVAAVEAVSFAEGGAHVTRAAASARLVASTCDWLGAGHAARSTSSRSGGVGAYGVGGGVPASTRVKWFGHDGGPNGSSTVAAAAAAAAREVFFSPFSAHGLDGGARQGAPEPSTEACTPQEDVFEERRGFELVWRLRMHSCVHVRIAVLQVSQQWACPCREAV